MSTNDSLPEACLENSINKEHWESRQYYKFVILSVAIWGTCFLLILIPRIFVFLCTRQQQKKQTNSKHRTVDQVLVEPSFYSRSVTDCQHLNLLLFRSDI